MQATLPPTKTFQVSLSASTSFLSLLPPPVLRAAVTLRPALFYWAFLEDLARLLAGRRSCSGIQVSS